jgi:hypothetical protein
MTTTDAMPRSRTHTRCSIQSAATITHPRTSMAENAPSWTVASGAMTAVGGPIGGTTTPPYIPTVPARRKWPRAVDRASWYAE